MNVIKVFDSTLGKDVWIDKNDNRWDVERFSKGCADTYSMTLEDCHNCVDCKLCGNCEDCVDCSCCCRCKTCNDCHYCEGLVNCKECYMCSYCDNSNCCMNSKNCNSAFAYNFRDIVIIEISKKDFMKWKCTVPPMPDTLIESDSRIMLKHIENLRDGISCDLVKLRDSNGLFHYVYYWIDNDVIISESDYFEDINDVIGDFDDGFGREFRTVLM